MDVLLMHRPQTLIAIRYKSLVMQSMACLLLKK